VYSLLLAGWSHKRRWLAVFLFGRNYISALLESMAIYEVISRSILGRIHEAE
jgi:hypothetical protein